MKVYNEKLNEEMSEELYELLNSYRKKRNFIAKQYIKEKALLLNRYLSKYHLNACVIAISGGIDSAVVLGIVNYAANLKNSPIKKIVPLLLPLLNSSGVTHQDEATERGLELCNYLKLKGNVLDLSEINQSIRDLVEDKLGIIPDNWAIGQLGPYSRTPIIYYTTSLLSSTGFGSIVCGTTNLDEGGYLGYVGKASDAMVDLQLISDIHKSEVYDVAKELNLPKSIINVIPTGDMYDDRSDEMVFGASYDFVELYLNYLNEDKVTKEKILSNLSIKALNQFAFYASNLEHLHKYNYHKYIAKSPAIHLDLWDSSVKDGWDNYYENMIKALEKSS